MVSVSKMPWYRPELAGNEEKYIHDVLESGYINDGNVTREFERQIANHVGTQYAVAVTSGTSAITLALMACGIGHGDNVIVPDLTFIATANAVRLTGASVKLADVDRHRLTIDCNTVAELIDSKTRAIVPVDVNGRGCDYTELEKLCSQHDLKLICDSAEALGSKWKSRFLGTYGNAGCFSFSANKTISCGQGGMIVTNDQTVHERLLELKDQGRRAQGSGGDDQHPVLGFNFKLTNLQAAVGLAQLEKCDERLHNAKTRDRLYKELLNDIPDITFPDTEDGEILQWTDILSPKRDLICETLSNENIDYRKFWFPLNQQAPYKDSDDKYANSISVSKDGVWLPSYFSITTDEIEQVAKTVRSVLQ